MAVPGFMHVASLFKIIPSSFAVFLKKDWSEVINKWIYMDKYNEFAP